MLLYFACPNCNTFVATELLCLDHLSTSPDDEDCVGSGLKLKSTFNINFCYGLSYILLENTKCKLMRKIKE
jgi:hypothetical protein